MPFLANNFRLIRKNPEVDISFDLSIKDINVNPINMVPAYQFLYLGNLILLRGFSDVSHTKLSILGRDILIKNGFNLVEMSTGKEKIKLNKSKFNLEIISLLNQIEEKTIQVCRKNNLDFKKYSKNNLLSFQSASDLFIDVSRSQYFI